MCDQQDHRTEESQISTLRTTLTAAGCAAAPLAGTTACGTVEHLSAGREAALALAKLGEQRSLTVEMSLKGDTDALFASALPADLPRELLTDAKLLVTLHTRRSIAGAEADDRVSSSVRLMSARGTLMEARTIGDDVFQRMNTQLVHGPEVIAQLRAQSAGTPVADAMGSYLDGGWLHSTAPAAEQGAAEDAEARGELLDALRDVATSEVRFRDAGHRNGAEIIAAEASPRGLVTALVEELGDLDEVGAPASALGGQFPGLPGGDVPEEKLATLPDDVVSLDLSVTHGVLTGLSLDLTQFDVGPRPDAHSDAEAGSEADEKAPEELSLDVRFGEARHRTVAPEDSTDVQTTAKAV